MAKENITKDTKIGLKVFIISISIILVVTLIGFGFLFLLKNKTDDNSNNIENKVVPVIEEKKEQLSLNDSRFYSSYLAVSTHAGGNITKDYTNLNGNNNLTNLDMLEMALVGIDFSRFNNLEEEDFYSISKADINAYLSSLFGKSISLDYSKIESGTCGGFGTVKKLEKDLQYGVHLYDFEDSKVLVAVYLDNPEENYETKLKKLVDAYKIDDEIYAVEKRIYSNYEYNYNNGETVVEYYYSYNINKSPYFFNKIGEISYTYETEDKVKQSLYKKYNIDNYLDKATTITYLFRLNEKTGNYYFVSSEIN